MEYGQAPMTKGTADDPAVRWQDHAIKQLTFANNLLIALGIAALGFGLSLMLNSESTVNWASNHMFLYGLGFLLLSVLSGILTALARLAKFRETAREKRRAQNRDSGSKKKNHVTRDPDKHPRYGFYVQTVGFFLGICLLAASIGLMYWDIPSWAKTSEVVPNREPMTLAKVIGSIGLLLDIVGVIIIAFFVRYDIYCDGSSKVKPGERNRRRLGWVLILIGFALQLIGLWL